MGALGGRWPAIGGSRGRRTVISVAVPTLVAVLVVAAALFRAAPDRAPPGDPTRVTVCGRQLCLHGGRWFLYGATVYEPGHEAPQSGIDNPMGTVALARAAHLNTVRLVNYLPDAGDPAVVAFDPAQWVKVDRMIAAVARAGMTVALDLSDYRNLLWNDCINPYTADWSRFIAFVSGRRNTVTGEHYSADPALSLVALAGEPLPAGSHSFTASTTGASCTIVYSTAGLTGFYQRGVAAWRAGSNSVLITSGGLGYLDFHSGIDWRSIFALPGNAVCGIKTYGGMLKFASTVAAYCASISKPLIDEEFGWRQSDGDGPRARAFDVTMRTLGSLDVAGASFWNLGYEVAPSSYGVSPRTPLTFAAVQRGARPNDR